MANIYNLTCEKCGSEDIEVFIDKKEDIPKPKISLEEWRSEPGFQVVNAMLTYNKEVAKCKYCGYRVERLR